MLTVTIFGATGQVGKHLVRQAVAKGWQVRAFGRQVESLIDKDLASNNFSAIKGYVFDAGEVAKAIKGSDAVLSALGGQFDGTDQTRSLGIKNITTQMEKLGVKRIVALGGLGVLDTPNGKGPLFEQPDYPPEYVPVALEHYAAYLILKNSTLNWTFICSPDILNLEADGNFLALAEEPAPGTAINAGNLAAGMIQTLEKNEFLNQRVGIANSPA